MKDTTGPRNGSGVKATKEAGWLNATQELGFSFADVTETVGEI